MTTDPMTTDPMTSKASIAATVGDDGARYWSLVHDGQVHEIEWADGERLLGLSTAVLAGQAKPQSFSFMPRGAASGRETVTLYLEPDKPIELLSEYEHGPKPVQSHWFG